MPDVETGDIYLASAIGTCFEQRIIFTQTYRVDASVPGTTEGTAALTLLEGISLGGGGLDLLESKYLALLSDDYELQRWRVQRIFTDRAVMHDKVRGVFGTNESTTATGNTAAVITLRTDFAGRKQVSNKHIGPIPTQGDVQIEGGLSAGYKTLLDTFANALTNGYSDLVTGLTFRPVIYHRTATPPFVFDYVTSKIVGDTVRVMRRRTLRIGE